MIAAPIPEKNNAADIVDRMIQQLEQLPTPVLASQEVGFDWITI